MKSDSKINQTGSISRPPIGNKLKGEGIVQGVEFTLSMDGVLGSIPVSPLK